MNRPVMSRPGLYDPTTIMNNDELNRGMKEGWIKLAFYIITFLYYLYRFKSIKFINFNYKPNLSSKLLFKL